MATEHFEIFIPSVITIDGHVQFSDTSPSPSPSPSFDEEDNNDNIKYLNTEEEMYEYHLKDSLDKNSDSKNEIKQVNDILTNYYNKFSNYCHNFKITKDQFIKVLDEFNTEKSNYQKYFEDLKDRVIINEDNPTAEDCPFILDIPIIKSKIDGIIKIIVLVEDTFSKIYILKIMNK